MGIYKKLLQLQKSVKGLDRDATGNNYRYVSGSKLLGVIRPQMDDLGILLKQEVVDISNQRIDYEVGKDRRPKSEILSTLRFRFTWIDCESGETDTSEFAANGQNDFDKGVGSALTYAERYFLLKFFHIATDEDDCDYYREAKAEADLATKKEYEELLRRIEARNDTVSLKQLYDSEVVKLSTEYQWKFYNAVMERYHIINK